MVYEVKSGDNLYNIAKAHKTTWKAFEMLTILNPPKFVWGKS
ncbi:MAG: hypothetical protein CM1200mP29_10150 [Verrucomicrobiota bacterium]|nr:MAG: hypothetical protein CM1200mP29_10150 [Verrucomicrobiota bacterium]